MGFGDAFILMVPWCVIHESLGAHWFTNTLNRKAFVGGKAWNRCNWQDEHSQKSSSITSYFLMFFWWSIDIYSQSIAIYCSCHESCFLAASSERLLGADCSVLQPVGWVLLRLFFLERRSRGGSAWCCGVPKINAAAGGPCSIPPWNILKPWLSIGSTV